MKLPKFSQKGIAHILAPIAFIGIFAAIGGIVLLRSHAASVSTDIYGYKDVNSFLVNNVQATKVNDSLEEDGAGVNGSIQVATLKAGDSLSFEGLGANIGGPTLLSTKGCFTLRDLSSTKNAVLRIAQKGGTYSYIYVKPSPVSQYPSSFWQYNCVPYSYGARIKLTSGSIHLYHVDLIDTMAY